jgi:hypothetical protein
MLTWVGVSLLAAAASALEPAWPRRTGAFVLSAVALVFAYATKETAAVVLPVSIAWLAIERVSRERRAAWTRFAATYALLNVVAATVFVVLRWHFAERTLAEGTYTRAYTVRLDTLGPALFRICAWMVRDFVFLVPLLAVAVLAVRRLPSEPRRLTLYACVWMVGWLAVYAPWPATFEYYLLPFAFGAAAFAGVVARGLWILCQRPSPRVTRRVAAAALAASALLWLPGVVNAAGDAGVQLVVDRANADLVDFLGRLPRGSRILLNTTYVNEYLHELALHLTELKHRPDIVVQHVGGASGGRATRDVFVATATIENQPGPTVRIAVHEAGVRGDARRLAEMLGPHGAVVYASERRVRVVELALHRLLCPLARRPFVDPAYCPGDRGVVHARTFAYGWRVDRVPEPTAARDETPT